MSRDSSPGPLHGLVVLDLTQLVSGAVASLLLRDGGARVLKVEPPGGETYRRSGKVLGEGDDRTSLNFLRFSRGKESIVIDLKQAEGNDVLGRLLERADVLIENFRPGVLARLGFPPEEIKRRNPRLVYTTVSGYGHDDLYPSPYRDRPAYALTVEAMAGLTHLAGTPDQPPAWLGFAMADIFAGSLAFSGTLLALGRREQTGEGGRVDIAMHDGAALMNDLAIATYSATGEVLTRGQYAFQSPWGSYETSDGYVAIAVLTEGQWRAFCGIIGRSDLADDPNLAAGWQRSAEHDALIRPLVSGWTAERTTAECVDLLLAAHVPAAPVNTAAEVVDCPQLRGRNMLVDVDDPVVGRVTVVGNPIKLDGEGRAPGRIPRLGEHTDEVLRELGGFAEAELEALRASGAIG
jgi:CoA:oxalate CoA-transferase